METSILLKRNMNKEEFGSKYSDSMTAHDLSQLIQMEESKMGKKRRSHRS